MTDLRMRHPLAVEDQIGGLWNILAVVATIVLLIFVSLRTNLPTAFELLMISLVPLLMIWFPWLPFSIPEHRQAILTRPPFWSERKVALVGWVLFVGWLGMALHSAIQRDYSIWWPR